MIAALFTRYTFLRVAVSMLLILFIGCKIAMPVFSHAKLSAKETSVGTEENDSDGEKKSDLNPIEKEKDFASFYSDQSVHIIWDIQVVHLTAYSNNYQSSYYNSITIPPPDRA